MTKDMPWKIVWITGASSGIGRELALRFARGGTTVAISARSQDKLDEVARLDPRIKAYALDVTDPSAVAEVHGRITRDLGPINLAVFNAGVWHPMTADDYDAEKARQSMVVNYTGVVNALQPAMREMIARGGGHIAIVASVAGYRGLPKGAAYGPTKAALINLAESLRPELASHGVAISIVNPGFVETPMTSVNDFPMPFIISAEDAAERIAKGLAAGRFEVVFPTRMAIAMKTLRLLPYWLFFRFTARMTGG